MEKERPMLTIAFHCYLHDSTSSFSQLFALEKHLSSSYSLLNGLVILSHHHHHYRYQSYN